MKKRLLLLTIFMMISLGFMPTAFADSNVDGVVTLDSIGGDIAAGTLQDRVEGTGITYSSNVKELHIGEDVSGSFNNDDITYINNMSDMEVLEVADTIKVGNVGDDFCSSDFDEYSFKKLREVTFPAAAFGAKAFVYNPTLEKVSLPEATTFGTSAFLCCDALEEVNLPSVTAFGGVAFFDCNSLNKLELGLFVPTIGSWGTGLPSSRTVYVPSSSIPVYDQNIQHQGGTATDGLWEGWAISSSVSSAYKTVYFDSQLGSVVSDQIVYEGYYAIKPNEPTRTGYTFEGWYTDSACTDDNRWNFNACPVTGDITLFAKWTAIPTATTYTVEFDSQLGTSVSDQDVDDGDYASKPSDPTRTDCTFGGWYTDSGCTDDNRWNFTACQVVRDITLYAKWTVVGGENVTHLVFDNTYKVLSKSTTYDLSVVCPYTVYPVNAADKSVIFSSSNPGVASISGGRITAHSEGRAEITVTANDTYNGVVKTTMMVEVVDSTSIGTSNTNTSIVGNVVDSNGISLSDVLVTVYSNPMDTLTGSESGAFVYRNIPYTNHTLVLNDDNGREISRFSLNFNNTGSQSINIDNVNNTANINYSNNTNLIDLSIRVNDTYTDINIIDSQIKANQSVPNPKTGEDAGM